MSARKPLATGPFECNPIRVQHGWLDQKLLWFVFKGNDRVASDVYADRDVRAWCVKHCAPPFDRPGTVLLQCQIEAYHQHHKILP